LDDFVLRDLNLSRMAEDSFRGRLMRRKLGVYKMSSFISIKGDKKITNIASILHFNIDACLDSTLREEDKELIRKLNENRI